ncbi:MAG: hypothetical protein R2873_14155 [Caldilineaceae bacterium]
MDHTTLDAGAFMDRAVALIDLKTAQRRHEDLRIWERAPYWYVERLGGVLGSAQRCGRPARCRARTPSRARLAATPGYLQTAQRNLLHRRAAALRGDGHHGGGRFAAVPRSGCPRLCGDARRDLAA